MCKIMSQPEYLITHIYYQRFREHTYKYVYFMVIQLKLEAENVLVCFVFHGICRVLNNQKRDQVDMSKHDFSALS